MERINSLDLARGFTVFIMPAAHTLLLYGNAVVHQRFLADVFRFLAEGPGAQLFMLLMGVSFTLSKKTSWDPVWKRALLLLGTGYLLNFFKFVIPIGLGIMPSALLLDFGFSDDLQAAQFFFGMGDILHFAAIASIILYLVSKLKYAALWSFLLAVTIMIVSPYVWDVKGDLVFVDQLLLLFTGHPPAVYFPVFPWLAYPLAGLTMGHLLKRYGADILFAKTGIAGLLIIIIACCLPPTSITTDWPSFYRTEPADTLFHLGFVLLWLAIIHWLYKKVKRNPFFNLLLFCSKHITTVYVIQWILICWALAIVGYAQLPLFPTMIWMCGMTVASLLFTYAISKTHVKKSL